MNLRDLTRSRLPEWLRAHFSDTQRYLILWIAVGVVCGLVAVIFHVSIDALFRFVWNLGNRMSDAGFVAFMIGAPTLGGLVTGLAIDKVAPSAGGSGIPQTKEVYYQRFGVFRLRDAFARFILGTVSVGMGMSLGREGPTVHICAAVASNIGQLFGIARKRVQALVPVGMGAGIAAAFNTPLAAMFFVFEELLGDFSSKALFGILVAVVLAAAVERLCLGEHPAFQLDLHAFETDWWMLICVPLGLLAAVLGHAFVMGLLRTREKFKAAAGFPRWLQPAAGGFGVGVIGGAICLLTGRHGVFAIGYADLSDALNGRLVVIGILLALCIGKFIATILAYSSGGSGGVFAPVLFIGGMFGAVVGVCGQALFGYEDHIVGAVAMLGMGAFFAAVIRCPLTSIMIIFEMTRNYALILPLMVGNILAYVMAARWKPVPLYDALLLQDKITLKKMPSYQGEQDWRNLPVSTIMTFDVVTVSGSLDASANLAGIGERHFHAYPVMGLDDRLIGMITHRELAHHARTRPAVAVKELLPDRDLVTLNPDASIRDVANILVIEDVMQAPVVSKTEPGKVLGMVTLHDIARQQNAITEGMGR